MRPASSQDYSGLAGASGFLLRLVRPAQRYSAPELGILAVGKAGRLVETGDLGQLVTVDHEVDDRRDREHSGGEGDPGGQIQMGESVLGEVEEVSLRRAEIIEIGVLAGAEAGCGAEIDRYLLAGGKRVADVPFYICALDLVDIVVDRQLRTEWHIQPRFAVDLPGVEVRGEPGIVVRVDVAGDATGQGGISDRKAYLGVGIELGEVERRRSTALADVTRVIVLARDRYWPTHLR